MKANQFFFSTLKETPAEAEIISHQLMLRAGLIKKLAAGIYSYMPLGLRVVRRIEAIIRAEMNAAGALEITMPIVQPAELWRESGRWDKMGAEMARLRDRHEREYAIQPTSEEVMVDIARQELRSWRHLPKNFYQIQTKFRDERRPRFGLMRGREFTMKDGYSFDRDREAAQQSYQKMHDAYGRIFDRMGLVWRSVAADSGLIGGDLSREFHVIADTGEDAIAYCPNSDYAANIEAAEALPLLGERAAAQEPLQLRATPNLTACADVARLLKCPLERTVKSIVLATEPEEGAAQIWLLLLRGDHALNEVKASKVPGLTGFRFAREEEIRVHFGCPSGYLGPIFASADARVRVIADRTVARMSDWVCGANREGHHLSGINWGRDLPEPERVADIRNVVEGDPSPDDKGALKIQRGIEVGHVFYLGTKYSAPMNAVFLGEDGQPHPFDMGTYGIGVTRIMGAAIEQNHDARGIVWPAALAPFDAVICPMGYERSEAVRVAADALHDDLTRAGLEVILDDRGERAGVMFAEWELIGIPQRFVISDKTLAKGEVEHQSRRAAKADFWPLAEAVEQALRQRQ